MAKYEQLYKAIYEIRLCVMVFYGTMNLKRMNSGRPKIAGIVLIAIAQFLKSTVVIQWSVGVPIMEAISNPDVAGNLIGHLRGGTQPTFSAESCQSLIRPRDCVVSGLSTLSSIAQCVGHRVLRGCGFVAFIVQTLMFAAIANHAW